MREELALTPEVIRKGVTDFEAAIREKAHLLPESGIKKIYAVGCGDSLFAAQAARYTFLDLFCTWLGFTLVVCVVGALREVLAYGRLWGVTLKGVVPVSRSIALPFFGFFLIAVLAAGFRFLNNSFRHWINKKEGK